MTAALGSIVVGCGCLILDRHRDIRCGRAAGFGLLWSVDGLFESWAAWGEAPGTLAGHRILVLVRRPGGAFLLVGLPLLLVIYPDGRLLGGCWRTISIAAVAMACALPLALR